VWTPIGSRFSIELVPAPERLLDQDLPDRGSGQTDLHLTAEPGLGRGETTAVAAERERGPDDGRHGQALDLREIRDDRGGGDAEAARLHGLLEELTVLGAGDHLDPGPDQLDPELVEDTRAVELERHVERGLAPHRRQQRLGALAPEDAGDRLEVERLQVGRVGERGVGHDRGGVRVDDDRAVALFAEHLERLAAGVVELARLADHDRPRADQADRMDVLTPRHCCTACDLSGIDAPRLATRR
jgi:hypothetical protein